ncbi:hypothetical protein K504DRAFT_496432 [Pleomassaria siparia CBS 279.74]|uniref:F-box domain-containing protein n=1 Tax=Pleomassaria siparia CBS 279.74 TaxID=1314801 RepID=A0A6G1KNT0_9PLEO|nr:hypothetical protein K504DRAFT_496432 [Pleomassaria siparia CBS 279.74]
MPQLSDLPTEILLEIAAYLDDSTRNRCLRALALTASVFRPIAQEMLLCAPSFHITYIHDYMWQLGHYPGFERKIKKLEILSSSEGRGVKDSRGIPAFAYPATQCGDFMHGVFFCCLVLSYAPADTSSPPVVFENGRRKFKQKCQEVARYFAGNQLDMLRWWGALDDDIVAALVGVLLVSLPSLEELYLGASWLMDFPFFSGTLNPMITYRWMPWGWRHNWLTAALLPNLCPRLKVLEFPSDLDNFCFYRLQRVRAIFDFRSFVCLTRLTVSMKALHWDNLRPAPADPTTVLPSTIKLLRISECSELTANFTNQLCLSKKKGQFPQLELVELFYTHSLEKVKYRALDGGHPDPVKDVKKMFMDAELQLYLYFPVSRLRVTTPDTRTPWNARDEGRLGQLDAIVSPRAAHLFRPFEMDLDRDGDVKMGGSKY